MTFSGNVFGSKPFPVGDDFFQPLELGERHLDRLRNEAAMAVRKALVECNKYQQSRGTYLVDCPPWRLHTEHGGLNAYTRKHRSCPTMSSSRIFGTIQGNFRDIASFFKTDSSADYLDITKLAYKYVVDAHVLRVVSHDSTPSSVVSETIKWAAFDAFALRNRLDSCHFESMGTGIDANGKPYAFRVIIPAIFPEVPNLYNSTRTVRVYHKSVMLLTPSDRSWNSTELFVSMQNDFNGIRVPRRLYKKYLVNLKKVMSFVDTRRIATAQRTVEPERAPEQCNVCSRHFSFLRSRHTCSICGETVCRKCFVKGSEVLQIKSMSKFCTPCIHRLRQPEEEDAMTMPTMERVETSYDHFLASYIRTGRHSSRVGWVTSPEAKPVMSRGRVGTDASCNTATSSSHHSQISSPGEGFHVTPSPTVAMIGDNGAYIEYIEESERASFRSVELTVDTSEMARVREDNINTPFHSTCNSTTSSASSSTELLHSIHSSLHEQEMLLRELHATVRVRRNTRKMSMHVSEL